MRSPRLPSGVQPGKTSGALSGTAPGLPHPGCDWLRWLDWEGATGAFLLPTPGAAWPPKALTAPAPAEHYLCRTRLAYPGVTGPGQRLMPPKYQPRPGPNSWHVPEAPQRLADESWHPGNLRPIRGHPMDSILGQPAMRAKTGYIAGS